MTRAELKTAIAKMTRRKYTGSVLRFSFGEFAGAVLPPAQDWKKEVIKDFNNNFLRPAVIEILTIMGELKQKMNIDFYLIVEGVPSTEITGEKDTYIFRTFDWDEGDGYQTSVDKFVPVVFEADDVRRM